jgi:hypothetical protein
MTKILHLGIATLLLACSPEADEAQDQAPADDALYSDDAMVINFGMDVIADWVAVNDIVMGGVSIGDVYYEDNLMIFEGFVSTDSNGGFTSVRGPQSTLDLSDYDRVLIRLRSEGQPFSMVLAHKMFWFEDQFKYDIVDVDADWQTLEIPLDTFENYSFNNGYPTATGTMMTPTDRESILHVEFMSKLFDDGDFRLEIDFIAFD